MLDEEEEESQTSQSHLAKKQKKKKHYRSEDEEDDKRTKKYKVLISSWINDLTSYQFVALLREARKKSSLIYNWGPCVQSSTKYSSCECTEG